MEQVREELRKSELESAKLLARSETFQCVEEANEKKLKDEARGGNEPTSPLNEEFWKELAVKREARQKAIAGISNEMERLKRELETERSAHAETKKLLDDSKKQYLKTSDETVEILRLLDLVKVSNLY